MKHLNSRTYIWILIGLSVLFYLGYMFLLPMKEMTLLNFIKPITTVVSLNVIFVYIFSKWLWKVKLFYDWLVPFPNLNGTWKGIIKSNWTDPETGNSPPPIPVILTIKQSFSHISCVMRTGEMTSYSFSSDFVIDKDNQVLRLIYSYDSIPKQTIRNRSSQHLGTIVLDIFLNEEKKELTGNYWTARKTTGRVELEYWKKEQISKYPVELGEHPVSKIRNNE